MIKNENCNYLKTKNKMNDIDIQLLKKKKKNPKKNLSDAAGAAKRMWDETDREYSYMELLDRIFTLVKSKNPNISSKKTCKMPPPQINKAGKKSVWINFVASCEALHRPQEHMMAFFLSELNTDGSLDICKNLILKGHFSSNQIRSMIMKYITMYVACNQCKSTDTILIKDPARRANFISCCMCNTKHYVASIKHGFHAISKGERKK